MNMQEITSNMIGKTVTIVGISHYYEADVFRVGEIFPCRKESAGRNGIGPIRITVKGLGTLGYLAGRKETAAEGTLLSSEIYRTVEDSFPIRIREISDNYVIAEIVSSSMQAAFVDAVPSNKALVSRLSPKHLDAYYENICVPAPALCGIQCNMPCVTVLQMGIGCYKSISISYGSSISI